MGKIPMFWVSYSYLLALFCSYETKQSQTWHCRPATAGGSLHHALFALYSIRHQPRRPKWQDLNYVKNLLLSLLLLN